MEEKRDYEKEIHESIRIYRQNRDLEAENEKLRNEKAGLKHILQVRNDYISELNNEKQEKSFKINEILNRLNKKLNEKPIKKTD